MAINTRQTDYFESRVNHLIYFYPQMMADKFKADRESLLKDIWAEAKRGLELAEQLEARGDLNPDQVDELVLHTIAPTNMEPPSKPMNRKIEKQVRNWLHMPD